MELDGPAASSPCVGILLIDSRFYAIHFPSTAIDKEHAGKDAGEKEGITLSALVLRTMRSDIIKIMHWNRIFKRANSLLHFPLYCIGDFQSFYCKERGSPMGCLFFQRIYATVRIFSKRIKNLDYLDSVFDQKADLLFRINEIRP